MIFLYLVSSSFMFSCILIPFNCISPHDLIRLERFMFSYLFICKFDLTNLVLFLEFLFLFSGKFGEIA